MLMVCATSLGEDVDLELQRLFLGVFGQYEEDSIVIGAGQTNQHQVNWVPESAGGL
jgi:hypothetical protein